MACALSNIEDLRADLRELEFLEKQATRPRLRNLFLGERRKLKEEIEQLEKGQELSKPKAAAANAKVQVKLTNYAWDQDERSVIFYVTLKNVKGLSPENVRLECTDRSVQLVVLDLDGKDYALTIKNLLKEIKPDQCTTKQKTDMVVINCPKVEQGYNWTHVTGYEKKAAESSKMDFDDEDKADPGDGLMNIMKKMYEKGDDEMKRTIAKAWTESQQQKNKMNP